MTEFFHGVETRRTNIGPIPANVIRTAIIGLICTAPVHLLAAEDQTVNQPVLMNNLRNVAQYCGPDAPGFTGPQAFRGIYAEKSHIAVMINVFDPARHKQSVVDEVVVTNANGGQLVNDQVITATVKNEIGDTTYIEGTDYSLDKATGAISIIAGGSIAANETLSVSYDYADLSLVTSSDVIGGIDGNGNRTGLKALEDIEGLYGFTPKTIISPGFCTLPTVAAAMASSANVFAAHAYIDAPLGTPFQDVIAGRGPQGTINFNIASDNVTLTWPHIRVDDGLGGELLEGMSARLAGVRARVDQEEGFHVSISEQTIPGVIGLEYPVYANRRDKNSEAQLLNANGILTMINRHGEGFKTFGNRASSFPSSSEPTTFAAVSRAFNIVDEEIELISEQLRGKPFNLVNIERLVTSANKSLDRRIADGIVLPGSKAWFDPAKNPAEELGAGRITISRRYMIAVPGEHIIHEAQIDISLYDNVAAQVNNQGAA